MQQHTAPRTQYLLVALLFAVSVFAWCAVHRAQSTSAHSHDKPHIVCTTGMIADAARAIGGSHIHVTCLMGPGIDPHLYRACEGDVHRLASADCVLYNGLHLEGKMAHMLAAMNRYVPTVAVTDTMPRERLQAPPDFPDSHDPHVWLDVTLWLYAVQRIGDQLSIIDPKHADYYTQNMHHYCEQLRAIDTYIRTRVRSLPKHRRILVTAHDAFGYFGTAYGFRVVGLQGISTESEAGTRDMHALVDFLVTNKIPAMFVESSVPQRAIEAVQHAARARGWDVAIGPELFSDALGNPDSPEATYLGMVKHNIDAIVDALKQCKL